MAYQSTHTGAQVDEAVDKALSADAVPTPGSTNLVQSGGVYGVLSNRNLLDNPFFTVNQRGSASYTSAGYTVDRWKLNVLGTTAQSVTVNTNGITLSGTASGSNSCLLRQTLENGSQYAGKTVTLSVLVGTVVGNRVRAYIGTNANERFAACSLPGNGVYTKTVTLPNDITSLFIQIGTHASDSGTGNISAEIRAVKLELGPISTLANDAPPNYAEELAKCQRYFIRLTAPSYGNGFGIGRAYAANDCRVFFPLPVSLRASPTVAATGLGNCALSGNGGYYAVTSVSYSGRTENGVILSFAASGLTVNQLYMLWRSGSDNAYIDLSADL